MHVINIPMAPNDRWHQVTEAVMKSMQRSKQSMLQKYGQRCEVVMHSGGVGLATREDINLIFAQGTLDSLESPALLSGRGNY